MTEKKRPDPAVIYPLPNYENMIYVKPAIKNPNIIVGDFTYFAGKDFEAHVLHHYGFNGDKLIIGKFCQIASGVSFIMNGANHQMSCASTYPFYIFGTWDEDTPAQSDMPLKGDTVIGNDVWIGQNATILPGVRIGDGAIIGMNSTVGSDIEPYTIAAGNPARVIRRRFDDELTALMLRLKWWDLDTENINALIPLLTCNDLEKVKREIKTYLGII